MRFGKLSATAVVGALGAILAIAPASAHWVGTTMRSSDRVAAAGAPHSATQSAAFHKGNSAPAVCWLANDPKPDATSPISVTGGNIDHLDITKFGVYTDGTNLTFVLHLLNLGDGPGGTTLSTNDFVDPVWNIWKVSWTNPSGHVYFMSASIYDVRQLANTSAPGWVFEQGYTAAGAATTTDYGAPTDDATGTVDVANSTITLTAPLSSFAFGGAQSDTTNPTAKPDPITIGAQLAGLNSGTYTGEAGAAFPGGFFNSTPVDGDTPDDANFQAWVAKTGCHTVDG